jgi:TonB family protein
VEWNRKEPVRVILRSFFLIPGTPFIARTFALGISAVAHVAVFAIAGANAWRAPVQQPDGLAEYDVTTEVEAVPIKPVDLPEPPPQVWHTHTHPYPVAADHDATPHDPSIEHAHADEHADEPTQEVALASDALTAAPDGQVARFSMINGGNAQPAHGRVGSHPVTGDDPNTPIDETQTTIAAHLVRSVTPFYTEEARDHEVEADVPLDIVVNANGEVVSARVSKPVGYGLDDSALRAVRQYRFSPAMRGSNVVSVRMHWTVQFRLQ